MSRCLSVCLFTLFWSGVTHAQKSLSGTSETGTEIAIPLQLGVGPAFHFFSGPLQNDDSSHVGIRISSAAILERQMISEFSEYAQQEHIDLVKKYPKMARRLERAYYRTPALALIPDTLILVPENNNASSIFGANWRLFGLGQTLLNSPRLTASSGVNITYLSISGKESKTVTDFASLQETTEEERASTTFFRPGIDFRVEVEYPITDGLMISLGWTSFFYPPQEIGGEVMSWGDLDDSIWIIGQAFLQLHYTHAYRRRLNPRAKTRSTVAKGR
jgi:hypothetical protein